MHGPGFLGEAAKKDGTGHGDDLCDQPMAPRIGAPRATIKVAAEVPYPQYCIPTSAPPNEPLHTAVK